MRQESQLMEKYSPTMETTAPAKSVSSILTRSFQPAQARITFFCIPIKCSQTEERFRKEPVIISVAPLAKAICNNLVPLVVVSTSVFPSINSLGYSKDELPY